MDEVHYLADRFRGRGVGRGHHRPGRVDPARGAVGDGEQRRGVRRLAVGGARRDGRGRLRATAGAALPARPGRQAALRPVRRRGARRRCRCPARPTREVNPALVRVSKEEARHVRDDSRRPRGRGGKGKRTVAYGSGAYGGAAHRSRTEGAAGRPRSLAVASRADLVTALDAEALLPAIVFIFSRAGCDAAVGQLLGSGLRLTSAERAERAGRDRRPSRRGSDRGGPAGAGLRQVRRGTAARGSPPTTPGCCPPSRRRVEEAYVKGPGQGGLRHRDAGARHQHAGPQRGAGEAGQVQRRDPRRHHAGGVHPADRPGRTPRHRRRGTRRRGLAAGAGPARRRRPGLAPHVPAEELLRAHLQHGRQPGRRRRPGPRPVAAGAVVRPVPDRPLGGRAVPVAGPQHRGPGRAVGAGGL